MNYNISVQTVIDKFPERFQPDAADDLAKSFQFMLEDDQDFFIEIQDGQCSTTTGEHPDPSITLRMNRETFLNIIMGEQDGMSAFMKGQLRAEGDVMLATKLGKLFKKSE